MVRSSSWILVVLAAILVGVVGWTLMLRGGPGSEEQSVARASGAGLGAVGLRAEGTGDLGRTAGGTRLSGGGEQLALERDRGLGRGDGARAIDSAGRELVRSSTVAAGSELPAMAWKGRVQGAIRGTWVEGARVVLISGDLQSAVLTDKEGNFQIDWFVGRTPDLKIEHDQYLDLNHAAFLLEPDAEFRLEPSAVLRGQVVPNPPQGGAEPSRVELWRETSKSGKDWPVQSASVDEHGAFEFLDLDPGSYSLCAFAGEWTGRMETGLSIGVGEQRFVELVCAKGATLEGALVWSGETASSQELDQLGGVAIELQPKGKVLPKVLKSMREVQAESEPDGTFTLEGIAPGVHRLVMETPWGARPTFQIEVDASGELIERKFDIEIPGALGGRVQTFEGRPAAGVLVSVVRRKDNQAFGNAISLDGVGEVDGAGVAPVYTDAEGKFQFSSVPVGESLYLVVPMTTTAPPTWLAVPALGPGELRGDLLLRLESGRFLSGFVRESSALNITGTLLEGVRIKALYSSDKKRHSLATATTDTDGSFRIGPLALGEMTLEVQLDGYIKTFEPTLVGDYDSPDVDLFLVKAMQVAGRVVDESGAAVPTIRLRASVEDPAAILAEKRNGTFKKTDERKRVVSGELAAPARVTNVDEFGRFQFPDMQPAGYFLEPQSPDWELAKSTPRLVTPSFAEGDEPVLLVVRRRHKIQRSSFSVSVVEVGSGLAPQGLSVGGVGGQVTIDAGEVRVTSAKSGPVEIRLTAENCVPSVLEVDLLPGQDHALGLVQLDPGARVTIVAKSKGGEALSKGVKVRLRSLSKDQGGAGSHLSQIKLKSIGGGRFRVFGVPFGKWKVRVDAPGYSRSDFEIVVNAPKVGQTTKLKPK
ncbi:MAG: carboxypeptidase-like regulatory domain-containing protein [Planctomycetota bacterium]|nr:carboxypeptidase-like regulatory domain-containing protein [Planctomycetota bacterium]